MSNLIEIHMIKNYPPTNLNRDDTGMPKSCYFGGFQRGRISSQCIKRSWRKSEIFELAVGKENIGWRTRGLPQLVWNRLSELGVAEEYRESAMKKISGIANTEGAENKKDCSITSQIAFYSKEDIEAVAQKAYEVIQSCAGVKEFNKLNSKNWQKEMKDVKTRPITLDIALFGRMITSDAFADVEASMQVAHAISTNKVDMDSDFFTAVGDIIEGIEDKTGSDMMGDIDFNSCCYYIYAALDIDQLNKNLANCLKREELISKCVPALLEAMSFSSPSGKQNSFAGHVFPEMIMLEYKKKKIPLSYVNAFALPAEGFGKTSLTQNSIEKFIKEVKDMDNAYGLEVEKRLWFTGHEYKDLPENFEKTQNFKELKQKLSTIIDNIYKGDGDE